MPNDFPDLVHQGSRYGLGLFTSAHESRGYDSAIAANHLRTSCRICYDRKLPKFPQTPDDGARCMSKPTKTTLQLETLVKQEAAKAMPLPKISSCRFGPMGTAGKSCATARIR